MTEYVPYQILTAAELNASIDGLAATISATTADLSNATSPTKGAALIGYISPDTGAAGRTLAERMGDAPSALDYTSLQAALNASAHTTLFLPPGSYTITAPLLMQPGTKLVLASGATIVQANGANLTMMIDCTTNAAHGVTIEGGAIDGNWANNKITSTFGIYGATANDLKVTGVTFKNIWNSPVYLTSGTTPVIRDNTFINTGGYGAIYIIGPTAQVQTNGIITNNRFLKPLGGHAIYTQNSDGNVIDANIIVAQQVTGMTVSVSGTSVTSNGSGVNNFLTNTDGGPIQVGSFIILGNGTPGATSEIELYVTAVNSATSLTVSSSGGSHTNFSAISGPGDLISISSASFTTISNNQIQGGSAGGIVVSNFTEVESMQEIHINGNNLKSIGNCGISIQSGGTGATQVFNNSITGNHITNCGIGGNATAGANYGILIETGSDPLFATYVDGNLVSNAGGATTQYWMATLANAGSAVMCGRNGSYNMANPGILGGISSIVLGAGWGSTATVSDIVSNGSSYFFTVTSSGTGQAANPLITINTVATSAEQPPIMNSKIAAGTAPPVFMIGEENAMVGVQTLGYFGTPVASNTYTIYVN